MIKLKEILESYQLKSSTGNEIIYYFETAQGSQYLFTDKGESKRWKSIHNNTGEEDKGLKEWYKNCVFTDPTNEHEANSFQFIDEKVRKTVTLSINDKKGVFYINENGKWRIATFSDSYPKFVKMYPDKKDKPLVFELVKEPKIGYFVLEYTLKNNDIIDALHFGSPVSKIKKIKDINPGELKNFNI
jgi:hypothetical protein